MSDRLADEAARHVIPPTGVVHLHLFVGRNKRRYPVYDKPHDLYNRRVVEWVKEYDPQWKVSTRASSVCRVPGRCVKARVIEGEVGG